VSREPTKVTQAQHERYCDYADTFGTDSGMRVLADLKAWLGGECHVSGDPHESQHRSSLRDVLIRIEAMIERASWPVEEEG